MFARSRPYLPVIALTIVLIVVSAVDGLTTDAQPVHGQEDATVRVLGGPPLTWDPARAGDTSSAAVLAQVFEGLTVLDADNSVQPALAESWTVSDDGRRVDFKLRPGLKYSDGTAVGAQHVVDSWFRLLDPQRPSPLVSLLADVAGATDYLAGRADRAAVGLHADADHVIVDLAQPATYFPAVTTSPSLALVPPSMFNAFTGADLPPSLVVSGAYTPSSASDTVIRLLGNANYWAGAPALDVVEVVLDTENRMPIDMFEDGDLDYLPISSFHAAWIRYDTSLGPQLRATPDLTLHFYGFDTATPPFSDPLVRQAFGKAVNWDRIVRLAGGDPALSMAPPGLLGAATEDFRPTYDPQAARELLSQAGFAAGAGFPEIALISNGYGYELAVANELERELGVHVTVELLDFSDILDREASGEHSKIWTQVWSADYPHANDFLGLLLQTGSASNQGRWSSTEYDALIATAAAAPTAAEQESHYAAAQQILRDQVPVVPVEALRGWALSRNGLLGALPSGAGFLRYADMAWGSDR